VVSKKLGNDGFLNKAPNDIVEQVKAKHAGLEEKQNKLESNLNRLKEMGS
jgi:valyl-tRNA synthetase